MQLSEILILAGTLITLAGLVGIIWCIITVRKARRTLDDDAALRTRLRGIVVVNLGALLASAIGLGLVIVGILFGT